MEDQWKTNGGSMNTNGGSVNTNEGSVSVILQLYFHYIVNVIIIGGGNQTTQRNPSTCPKWMTNLTNNLILNYNPFMVT
jgi:hypothetical protein